MTYKAEIDVMPRKELLDPQGKAVTASMGNLNLSEISNIRIGKHITLTVDADTQEVAETKVTEACKKLLANEVMEYFEFTLSPQ